VHSPHALFFRLGSFLLLLPIAACLSADPGVAPQRAAIAGGTPEPGEPAVVGVKLVGGVASCTGTLISPHVVLTAKHCVQLSGADAPVPPGLLSISLGSSLFGGTDYRVRRVDTTPGRFNATGGLSGALVGIDVAVMTIRPDASGNLPDVTPMAIFRGNPEDVTGQDVTFVGYGERPDGSSGDKYTKVGHVDSVRGGNLFSSGNICSGDSGGPMIWEDAPGGRAVVGVASYGSATASGPSCPSVLDAHNVLQPFLGMIDAALYEAGDCPFVADEVCNGLDDNCDGVVDEGCLGLGEACDSDDQCAFSQLPERFEPRADPVTCVETPAGRVCTHACDPRLPSQSCATMTHAFDDGVDATPGAYCMAISGCAGQCVAGSPGALTNGSDCTADTDCASLACFDPGDGRARCLTRCQGGEGQCAVSEVCGANVGVCGGCLPAESVAGARAFGEGCALDADCGSGSCLLEGSTGYCTVACTADTDCPALGHCRDALCRLGAPAGDGLACLTDEDCVRADSCRVDGAGAYCSHSCSRDQDCGFGTTCDVDHCAPSGGLLGEACAADPDCASGSCLEVAGERICTSLCGASGACPTGLDCVRGDAAAYCGHTPAPTSGGGCAVSPSRDATPAWLLVALSMLGLGRRFSSSRRRCNARSTR